MPLLLESDCLLAVASDRLRTEQRKARLKLCFGKNGKRKARAMPSRMTPMPGALPSVAAENPENRTRPILARPLILRPIREVTPIHAVRIRVVARMGAVRVVAVRVVAGAGIEGDETGASFVPGNRWKFSAHESTHVCCALELGMVWWSAGAAGFSSDGVCKADARLRLFNVLDCFAVHPCFVLTGNDATLSPPVLVPCRPGCPAASGAGIF